jgi:FtsP/CotA-like multicopper oxidase with cupredoxin domain
MKHPWVIALLLASALGCEGSSRDDAGGVREGSGPPSTSQVPLDPLTIPKFAHELPRPRVFAPTEVRQGGVVIRHQYTVSIDKATVQMLPPGFPNTTVFAYGGDVKIPGSSQVEFVRTVPGPVFDNVRGIPTRVMWRNQITTPHFMPIDPTLHWANPNAIESPIAPFTPFPPGYPAALSPVPHVTHNHGLVVSPTMDGTAEEWFTSLGPTAGPLGPSFSTRDYTKPNEQPGTQLFYHDHTMGMTRMGVYSGLVGTAYFIRDPNNPLDQSTSPLPRGEFEIPLVLFDRAFFTDGELSFPRVSTNPGNAYWQAGDGANTVLVNGKVWPNLNVKRQQYRFRVLGAGNGRVWNIQLSNAGTLVPMTLIGSDGGYLPAPQVVTGFQIGITERADVLVDFSQFPAGTQITMLNAGANAATVGTIMRFTVVDSPAVSPPALPAFPARPTLTADAPTKVKTMHVVNNRGNVGLLLDGLDFTSPTTEFSLVGSTERWDLVQLAGVNHQIHLHLIEFQVVDRQPIDAAAYQRQWQLLNGFRPVSRPIVVDPAPFFTGPPTPPLPYETGWKDTVRAPGGQVTRIIARWAPQEVSATGSTPGVNQFPIDPTVDPGYMWHCHVLGHEDNDMMRKLIIVNKWAANKSYPVGTVIEHQGVNYRARVTHNSQSSQSPTARFDLWERVNNNDGTWQPQIIYAKGDRVLHEGSLYMSHTVHQAQAGQPPPSDPANWAPFPTTACAQFQELCHGGTDADQVACHDLGHAGDEAACLGQLSTCLAACQAVGEHGHVATPCSGLCQDPVSFVVPDGTTFSSGALGTGASCFETTSELLGGATNGLGTSRSLTINGKKQPNNAAWPYPLPTQRNHGYCIEVTAGSGATATFTAN